MENNLIKFFFLKLNNYIAIFFKFNKKKNPKYFI